MTIRFKYKNWYETIFQLIKIIYKQKYHLLKNKTFKIRLNNRLKGVEEKNPGTINDIF